MLTYNLGPLSPHHHHSRTFHTLWKNVADNIENYVSYPRLIGECGGKNYHLLHPSGDAQSLVNGWCGCVVCVQVWMCNVGGCVQLVCGQCECVCVCVFMVYVCVCGLCVCGVCGVCVCVYVCVCMCVFDFKSMCVWVLSYLQCVFVMGIYNVSLCITTGVMPCNCTYYSIAYSMNQ